MRHLSPLRNIAFLAALLTACAGSAAPRGVRGPYLQNLGADHVTICWETPRAATASFTLTEVEGGEEKTLAVNESKTRHEFVVPGLRPGVSYQYSVLINGKNPAGTGTFRTAPPEGEPVRFVAWGDSRKGDKIAAGLAGRILKTGAGMCIHSGDLVSDGKRLDEWDKYVFGPLGDMMRSVCLWPAVGNHDLGMMPKETAGGSVFNAMFALPDAESYYSFDYGNAHFLVLDSENPTEAQYEFAVRDLEANDSKWLFAVAHRPPFSSSAHPSDVRMRTRYLPLLAKHNMDVLIVGHNHNYMLSKPIRHVYEPEQKHPYIQVVTGGGGAYPADSRTDDLWFDRAKTAFHFVLFEIDGDRLVAQVIDGRGRVIDRFTIDRSQPADEEVAYEQIELERYLRGINISNTNVEGWPTGYLLEPGQDEGTLSYAVSNPLLGPLDLRLQFDLSSGLEFSDDVREICLEDGENKVVEVPFRVTSPDSVYPLRGPAIAYASSVGSATVQASAPPLALGRRVDVPRISMPVVVDGTPGEEAWRDSPVQGRFILWAKDSLRYQDDRSAASLRVLHDGRNLYLNLRRLVESSDLESIPPSTGDADHFTIYFAARNIALAYTVDIAGRTSVEGTKGLGDGVESAFSVSDRTATWEIKIPLERFLDDLDGENGPFFFNVMDKRGGEYFSLSPTFRQFFERKNSARLALDF